MSILWKPNGALDINTEATDLPDSSDGKGNIYSGAMIRCKNLFLSRNGMLSLRSGSSFVMDLGTSEVPQLIFDSGGNQYVFTENEAYYNGVLIESGTRVDSPVFDIPGGSYVSEQTVTITCALDLANIYYTLDGEEPTSASMLYSAPVLVPAFSWLKAIAIDPRGYLSDSDVVTGFYSLYATNVLETEINGYMLITETNSNAITTEGP